MKQKKDSRKEIEDLKKLREIDALIKRGDIENAFISNASKDSEMVSEAVADDILNKLDSEHINTRDISSIISLTSNRRGTVVKKQSKAVAKKAKAKPVMQKHKKANAQNKKKAQSKKQSVKAKAKPAAKKKSKQSKSKKPAKRR